MQNREGTAKLDPKSQAQKESLIPLDNILLYTNGNLIGHSIHRYLIDSREDITRFGYDDVIHEKYLSLAQTVVFDLINKDVSAIRVVNLLNALHLSLQRCQ